MTIRMWFTGIVVFVGGLMLSAQPVSAQTAPSVVFLAPARNATINDSRIVLTLRHTNFTYDAPAANNPAKMGRGHYRVFVDDTLAAVGYSDAISLPNDVLPTIKAGSHTLRVGLYDAANTAVVGAGGDTMQLNLAQDVSYKAEAGTPSITIVGDPIPDGYGHIQIRARIGGFFVDPAAINLPEEPLRGHYHIYLDGNLVGVGESDVSALPADLNPGGITPGQHKLTVILETHRHNPIQGQKSDERMITIAATALQQTAPQPTPQPVTMGDMPGMSANGGIVQSAPRTDNLYPGAPAVAHSTPVEAWQIGVAGTLGVLGLTLLGGTYFAAYREARVHNRPRNNPAHDPNNVKRLG